MTRLELLRQKNPDLVIHTVDEPLFSHYARLVSSPVFGTLTAFIGEYTTIPERNTYVADVLELHTPEIDSALCAFYGGLVPQIGYCNGKNFSMNGSEYHKGPELTIAVTDCLMWWMLPEDPSSAFTYTIGLVVQLYSHLDIDFFYRVVDLDDVETDFRVRSPHGPLMIHGAFPAQFSAYGVALKYVF